MLLVNTSTNGPLVTLGFFNNTPAKSNYIWIDILTHSAIFYNLGKFFIEYLARH